MHRRALLILPILVGLVALALIPTAANSTTARAAAVCSDYESQAEAQRAADTVDGDGDGIFCESLPCPCAGPSDGDGSGSPTSEPRRARATCTRTRRVVEVGISRTRYPAVLAHIRRAIRAGWPRVLRIHRRGAEQRRTRALRGWPTKRGFDRDEWPMAMGRRTWRAHVAYVPSGQNRGAGSSISLKLRRYCDGVRFTVVGY